MLRRAGRGDMIRPRHRPARLVPSLVVAGLAVILFIVTAYRGAAAQSGAWEQQAPLGAVGTSLPLIHVQCPGTDVCYAVGNPTEGNPPLPSDHPVFQKTVDGGATWTVQELNVRLYDS